MITLIGELNEEKLIDLAKEYVSSMGERRNKKISVLRIPFRYNHDSKKGFVIFFNGWLNNGYVLK